MLNEELTSIEEGYLEGPIQCPYCESRSIKRREKGSKCFCSQCGETWTERWELTGLESSSVQAIAKYRLEQTESNSCPFCGEETSLVKGGEITGVRAQCQNCGARGPIVVPSAGSPPEAIDLQALEAWNDVVKED